MMVFDALIDLAINVVGYTVAWFIFPLITFQKVYVEPLNSSGKKFKLLGYRYDDIGRIEIASSIAGFIGFIILFAVLIIINLLVHAAS